MNLAQFSSVAHFFFSPAFCRCCFHCRFAFCLSVTDHWNTPTSSAYRGGSRQLSGANPTVIAKTVATPLEQAINGVENILYISSQSTADGTLGITVTFALGTNLDDAQVAVLEPRQSSPAPPAGGSSAVGVVTAKVIAGFDDGCTLAVSR